MIIHQSSLHRFALKGNEDKAFMEYTLENNVCTVKHTEVDKSLAGQGIAAQLAQALYDWVVSQKYILHSECSYMSRWMKRHSVPDSNDRK